MFQPNNEGPEQPFNQTIYVSTLENNTKKAY